MMYLDQACLAILVLSTSNANDKVTTIIAILMSILVAVGAGIRVYKSIKNKTIEINTLEDLVEFIYSQDDIMDMIESLLDDESLFLSNNSFEELKANLIKEINKTIEEYISKLDLPDFLISLKSIDNLSLISNSILETIGCDSKMLEDIYTFYKNNKDTDSL